MSPSSAVPRRFAKRPDDAGQPTSRPRSWLLGLLLLAALAVLAGCVDSGTDVAPVDLNDSGIVLTDTDELSPGTFVAFGNGTPSEGLLVGTHPDADVGRVPVEVEEIDPAQDPDWNASAGVAETGRFYEIHTSDGDQVRTEPDRGFIVGLPVTEDLDEDHLVPVAYTDREHTHVDLEPAWVGIAGTYDDQQGLFVVDLPGIGNATDPTRIGLVEHETAETENTDALLSPIIREHFASVDDLDPGDGSGTDRTVGTALSLPTASATSPVRLDHRSGHQAQWYIICRVDSCPASDISDIRTALDDALDVYKDLDNNPRPSISTTTNSKFRAGVSVYKINIGTPPLGPDECNSDSAPGWYDSDYNTLIVCPRAGPSTAAHELFHSMQWNLASHYPNWDGEVAEGTAKLADNYADPEEPGNTGVPDLTQPLSLWKYDAAHFFSHLLKDTSADFDDLGDLFYAGPTQTQRGIEFEDLQDWVPDETSGNLGDAYWAFAKDLAYENEIPVGDDDCDFEDDDQRLTRSITLDASDPASADVPDDDSIKVRLEALESAILNLSLPAGDYDPYRVEIEQPNLADDTAMKLYDDGAVEWEPTGCRSDERETQQGAPVELAVYERDKNATLLVSDLSEADVDYETGEVRVPPSEYFLDVTFEAIPEDEIPYPEAPNLTVEFPPTAGPSLEIDVLDEASHPEGAHQRLVLTRPDVSISRSTPQHNSIGVDGPRDEITFELDYADWYGEDEFTYEIEDERTGLADEGTVTVARGVPDPGDDRYVLDASTAESWEQESWSIRSSSDVDPVTIDVLANDENKLAPGTAYDRSLEIPGADARHGSVEVVTVSGTEAIRYWPDPGGERAWSSSADGPRRYMDTIAYTIENAPGLRDTAEAIVTYHSPPEGDVAGGSPPPAGNTCSFTASSTGAAAVTLMQGEAPASYVRSAEGDEWTEIATPEGQAAVVQAIDGDGRAVGWTVDEEGDTQAFTWSQTEGFQPLAGNGQTLALAADREGAIAGAAFPTDEAPIAVVWEEADPRRIGEGLEGGSIATAIDGGHVVGLQGLTPAGGPLGPPSSDVGCDDGGIGPPGGGTNGPACPGERFEAVGVDDGTRGRILAAGPEGLAGPEGASGFATGGQGPLIPRGVSRSGGTVGLTPQDPTGPMCPTTAMMHTEEGTQLLAPLEGEAFSDAFEVHPEGLVAGVSGTAGEDQRGVLWDADGRSLPLDDALDLPEGWSIEAATGFTDAGEVLVLADTPEHRRPLSLATGTLRALAGTEEAPPVEEEVPRFEMEAGSAAPGEQLTATLRFVNDDVAKDRVEVQMAFDPPVSEWEVASTEDPDNVEGEFSETTLEAWAGPIPAGETVEASATFHVPEDAQPRSYDYQPASATIDGEELEDLPSATFTVTG